MLNSFHESILKSLTELKIDKFTEIQTIAIPKALENKNVIGLSETGSGKTLAFVIPLIQKTIGKSKKNIHVLILTPTKELCAQVHAVVKKLSKYNSLLSLKIIGGDNINEQIRSINKGQHIVLATPGRLSDLITKNAIDLRHVDIVVLDEADIMMDMGYLPQIELIIDACENRTQTLVFSATMNDEAKIVIDRFLPENELININSNKPKEVITEIFCPIKPELKIPFLKYLIKKEKIRAGLIFCNTKEGARFLFESMFSAKYKVALIQGDMSTHQRKISLDKLRRKEIQFLIATDVASRGIDIPHITHIINFEVPLNKDSYIHRIGRSARFEGSGQAFTLFNLETDEKDILRIKESIDVRKYPDFDYNLKIKKK
jgi:ATP-dependent RNA helicase DeaD